MTQRFTHDPIAPHGGVRCPRCGPVPLDIHEYERQMNRADDRWHCPTCGGFAEFDDAAYERLHPQPKGKL